jgi:hypothetical protein
MTTKIALFGSFASALTVTLLMWIAGYDWLATLGTAAVICAALPDMLLRHGASALAEGNAAGRSRDGV